MKKLLFLTALCCVVSTASAQQEAVQRESQWFLKPMAGINVSTLRDTGDDGHADMKIRFAGGMEFGCRTSEYVGLSSGIIYSQQGCKVSAGTNRGTYKLDYINIPLLFNLYLTDEIVLKLGLQAGWCANAEMDVDTSSYGVKGNMSIDMRDGVNDWYLSLPIGVSVVTESGVTLDLRYNWGLSEVEKDKMTINGTTIKNTSNRGRHSLVMFTLGFNLDL
jgi:hypothetical protein